MIFIINLLLFNNLRIYKIRSLVLPELRSRHINRNGCEKTTFWKYFIYKAVYSNASTEISKPNNTCNLKAAHVMRVFLSCPIYFYFSELSIEEQRQEVYKLEEKVKCLVCKTNERAIAFLPCGHIVHCTFCDSQNELTICFVCNEHILARVHVKMSKFPH